MNQDLTTLAKFKAWYNIKPTSTDDDDLIGDLISAASLDILSYLDRKSVLRETYPEYRDGTGGFKMLLNQWPVLSVNSLTINGLAQNAAVQPNTGYFLDPWDGFLPGRPQYITFIGNNSYPLISPPLSCGWGFVRGQRNVYINYDAGYSIENEAATIPTSPYQITASQPLGTWAQDDGVTGYTKVTGSPTTGQYSVNAGVYTFAAADTGNDVLINYSYIPKPLEQACFVMAGEQYAYRQKIGQKSHTLAGNTTVSFDNSIMTAALVNKLQPFRRMVPY